MKAILVVDIPDGYGDVYDNKAVVTLRNGKLGTSLGIYNVPLKPMPLRHDNNESEMVGSIQMDIGYTLGYNACIDELLGETE